MVFLILVWGFVVEMVIGEGKIFVVMLVVIFGGLLGCGMYVVIMNIYFVECDCLIVWFGCELFGLIVVLIGEKDFE